MATLTGEDGIINNAHKSVNKNEEAKAEEKRKLAKAEALMNTVETEYEGVKIPQGFSATKVDGESIPDEGIVITDSVGNEYVWVEVPRTAEVYPTAGINIEEDFTDTKYENIEKDLKQYASPYALGSDSTTKDEFTRNTDTDLFANAEAYKSAKQKMLKSVYTKQGFFIGRYEAGRETPSPSTPIQGETTEIPLSQKDLYPYTNITLAQAERLAEQVSVGDYTSSLMFGIQWDLTLKFIEQKAAKASNNPTQTKTDYINKFMGWNSTYSVEMGNYANSVFKINRGKYLILNNWTFGTEWKDYTTNTAEFVENSNKIYRRDGYGILLTTGASEDCKLANIYDLAGNVHELTLEQIAWLDHENVARGDVCGILNGKLTKREYIAAKEYSSFVGFRVTLY